MKNLYFLICLTLSFSAVAQKYHLDSFDINKSNVNVGHSSPFALFEYKNKLVFFAFEPINKIAQLHQTDGTYNPKIVDTVNLTGPGLSWSKRPPMIELGGTLFFSATDSKHDIELWKYDGTNRPVMIADIYPGNKGSFPGFFKEAENKIYFKTQSKTDVTHFLYEYSPYTNSLTKIEDSLHEDSELAVVENKVYFVTTDITNNNATREGTIQFYDIPTKTVNKLFTVENIEPYFFTYWNGYIYFCAETNAGQRHHTNLYRISTSTNQVEQVTDSNTLNNTGFSVFVGGPHRSFYIEYKDQLYFTSKPNIYEPRYLFRYDDKTKKVAFIDSVINAHDFCIYRNKLFFCAQGKNTHGHELWVHDGINKPKLVFSPSNPPRTLAYLTVANDKLFYSAISPVIGRELFMLEEDTALSIDKVKSNKTTTTLYPNPAKEIAHLQFNLAESNTLNVAVTDMQGRTVYKSEKKLYSTGSHTIEIPTNKLPQGTYIYQLKSENKVLGSGKLIKQ